MANDSIWWRLVHLEPTVLRGAITGVIGLAGMLGLLIAPNVPDAFIGAWVPLMAIVQVLTIRPAVTANAKVVVEAPDPIGDPGRVVAGQAVTTATNMEIVTAAKTDPRG